MMDCDFFQLQNHTAILSQKHPVLIKGTNRFKDGFLTLRLNWGTGSYLSVLTSSFPESSLCKCFPVCLCFYHCWSLSLFLFCFCFCFFLVLLFDSVSLCRCPSYIADHSFSLRLEGHNPVLLHCGAFCVWWSEGIETKGDWRNQSFSFLFFSKPKILLKGCYFMVNDQNPSCSAHFAAIVSKHFWLALYLTESGARTLKWLIFSDMVHSTMK